MEREALISGLFGVGRTTQVNDSHLGIDPKSFHVHLRSLTIKDLLTSPWGGRGGRFFPRREPARSPGSRAGTRSGDIRTLPTARRVLVGPRSRALTRHIYHV